MDPQVKYHYHTMCVCQDMDLNQEINQSVTDKGNFMSHPDTLAVHKSKTTQLKTPQNAHLRFQLHMQISPSRYMLPIRSYVQCCKRPLHPQIVLAVRWSHRGRYRQAQWLSPNPSSQLTEKSIAFWVVQTHLLNSQTLWKIISRYRWRSCHQVNTFFFTFSILFINWIYLIKYLLLNQTSLWNYFKYLVHFKFTINSIQQISRQYSNNVRAHAAPRFDVVIFVPITKIPMQ